MKVLQLIDSLQPGGAERMAVNLANELSGVGFDSYLCVSREEGLLKDSINPTVSYLHLKKRNTFDLTGIRKLLKTIKTNKIEVIHAHSSSFFWATLVKVFYPKVRLIWHDHYGNSEKVDMRSHRTLRFCSRYFDGIISVNEILRDWADTNLRCNYVRYIRNFVSTEDSLSSKGLLKGEAGLRIICLANLRRQKDHFNLLRSFKQVQKAVSGASLHIVGKAIDAEYTREIMSYVDAENIDQVYFLGAQQEVHELLKEATVGVLSSISEGLPVALLEYGINGLPVVCTKVGQCEEVVGSYGKLVPADNSGALAEALVDYLKNPEKAQTDARFFRGHIEKNYSFQAILPELKEMYER
ncbi:MAG: glycosyltransferase [Flavobacteriaceae bacterium]|nr:glycosyltransferase [Flavobacteriaceae bacterium]